MPPFPTRWAYHCSPPLWLSFPPTEAASSGPAVLTCFPGHPLPPCEAAKPVPLPPCDCDRLASAPSAPCPRPAAGSLHSHFLSPALEPWRPGPAAPAPGGHVSPAAGLGKSPPSLLRTSGLPTLLPDLHPSAHPAGPKGGHAPASGCLSLRPGLGATPAGPLLWAPGCIPSPAGEGWEGCQGQARTVGWGLWPGSPLCTLVPSRGDP